MDGWRVETFELLGRVASTARERWPDYAAFASLQARGLRRDAMAALRRFADQQRARSFEARWDFVRWLFEQIEVPRDVVVENLVPFPLKTAVVVPTLLEALRAREAYADAYLWMVRHYGPELFPDLRREHADPIGAMLREGILKSGGDPRLERALAVHLLGLVVESGADLAMSHYRGDPTEDARRLARARQLLDGRADALAAAIDRAEELVTTWQACRAAGAGDFVDWCRAHAVVPPPRVPTYYDE